MICIGWLGWGACVLYVWVELVVWSACVLHTNQMHAKNCISYARKNSFSRINYTTIHDACYRDAFTWEQAVKKITQVTHFEGLNGNFEDTCDIETNLACSSSPHPRAGFSPNRVQAHYTSAFWR